MHSGSDLTTAVLEAVWAKDTDMDKLRAVEFAKLLVTVTSQKTGQGIVDACVAAQESFVVALAQLSMRSL